MSDSWLKKNAKPLRWVIWFVAIVMFGGASTFINLMTGFDADVLAGFFSCYLCYEIGLVAPVRLRASAPPREPFSASQL